MDTLQFFVNDWTLCPFIHMYALHVQRTYPDIILRVSQKTLMQRNSPIQNRTDPKQCYPSWLSVGDPEFPSKLFSINQISLLCPFLMRMSQSTKERLLLIRPRYDYSSRTHSFHFHSFLNVLSLWKEWVSEWYSFLFELWKFHTLSSFLRVYHFPSFVT